MKNSPILGAACPPGQRLHRKPEKAGEEQQQQQSADKRDMGSFSTADSYVLFCERVCMRVLVCGSLPVCVHAYLFRKIDSLLMLRAAMRLPWLIAECCCVHVRASVWLSVCGWDWQSPYRLRASCREQSTGIILHSRPKHLNTQSSNSPKSDKAEADIGTSMSVCVCMRVCERAHSCWPCTNGEKTPAGSPDM